MKYLTNEFYNEESSIMNILSELHDYLFFIDAKYESFSKYDRTIQSTRESIFNTDNITLFNKNIKYYITGNKGINYIFDNDKINELNCIHKDFTNENTTTNYLFTQETFDDIEENELTRESIKTSFWYNARQIDFSELFKSYDYDLAYYVEDDDIDYNDNNNIIVIKKFLENHSLKICNFINSMIADTNLYLTLKNNRQKIKSNDNILFSLDEELNEQLENYKLKPVSIEIRIESSLNINKDNDDVVLKKMFSNPLDFLIFYYRNYKNIKFFIEDNKSSVIYTVYNNDYDNDNIIYYTFFELYTHIFDTTKGYNSLINYFNNSITDTSININTATQFIDIRQKGGTTSHLDSILQYKGYELLYDEDNNIINMSSVSRFYTHDGNIADMFCRIFYNIRNIYTGEIITITIFDIKWNRRTPLYIENGQFTNYKTSYSPKNLGSLVNIIHNETINGIQMLSFTDLLHNNLVSVNIHDYKKKAKSIFRLCVLYNLLINYKLLSSSAINNIQFNNNKIILLLDIFENIYQSNNDLFDKLNVMIDYDTQYISYGNKFIFNKSLILDKLNEIKYIECDNDNKIDIVNELINKYYKIVTNSDENLNDFLFRSENINYDDTAEQHAIYYHSQEKKENEIYSKKQLALMSYYNEGYTKINRTISRYINDINKTLNTTTINTSLDVKENESIIDKINNILNFIENVDNTNLNDEYMLVFSYRPFYFYNLQDNYDFTHINFGDIIKHPYFMSTTYSIDVISREYYEKDGGYLFILFVKQRDKYINITRFSSYNSEKEIILPPGKIIFLEQKISQQLNFNVKDGKTYLKIIRYVIGIYENFDIYPSSLENLRLNFDNTYNNLIYKPDNEINDEYSKYINIQSLSFDVNNISPYNNIFTKQSDIINDYAVVNINEQIKLYSYDNRFFYDLYTTVSHNDHVYTYETIDTIILLDVYNYINVELLQNYDKLYNNNRAYLSATYNLYKILNYTYYKFNYDIDYDEIINFYKRIININIDGLIFRNGLQETEPNIDTNKIYIHSNKRNKIKNIHHTLNFFNEFKDETKNKLLSFITSLNGKVVNNMTKYFETDNVYKRIFNNNFIYYLEMMFDNFKKIILQNNYISHQIVGGYKHKYLKYKKKIERLKHH